MTLTSVQQSIRGEALHEALRLGWQQLQQGARELHTAVVAAAGASQQPNAPLYQALEALPQLLSQLQTAGSTDALGSLHKVSALDACAA